MTNESNIFDNSSWGQFHIRRSVSLTVMTLNLLHTSAA